MSVWLGVFGMSAAVCNFVGASIGVSVMVGMVGCRVPRAICGVASDGVRHAGIYTLLQHAGVPT